MDWLKKYFLKKSFLLVGNNTNVSSTSAVKFPKPAFWVNWECVSGPEESTLILLWLQEETAGGREHWEKGSPRMSWPRLGCFCLRACSQREARFPPGWVASCQSGNPELSARSAVWVCWLFLIWLGNAVPSPRAGKRFAGFPGIHLPYDNLWHFWLWAGSGGGKVRRKQCWCSLCLFVCFL